MIGKLKKFFGIEGVKLELIIPETVHRQIGYVEGKIRFQSMNAQEVTLVKLAFVERYTRGRGENKMIDDYEIGSAEIPLSLEIPVDEAVEINFKLPFQLVKSNMDEIADKNIFYRGFVRSAKYFSQVKSEFKVVAEAKVKGTALNPFDKKSIVVK